jgi:DNA polymerase-3 subunit delta'
MPSRFKDFLGNRNIVQRFLRAVGENRLASAAILAGPEGVGKKTFALLAAQYLNCYSPQQEDSCGTCVSCLKIASGIHPDVRLIEPEGLQIKIEQTREVSSDVQFRPFEGKRKVYVFDQAEKLNEAAANSLLKTLEEPPGYAWIVLVTAHPDALLATIRSRCPVYRFAPVPAEDIEQLLKQQGIDPIRARTRARLSRGSVGGALSQDWEQLERDREQGLHLLRQLAEVRAFHGVHDFWTKLTPDEQKREKVQALLNLLLVLLHDVFLVKEGQASNSANTDIIPRLEEVVTLYSFDRICELEAQLRAALREIQRNVNAQILVESLYYERR